MMTKMVFSGFGGQGILTLGELVATMVMHKGKQVTWMPSYGIEMRGGTANCGVVVSDGPIGSPFVLSDLDILCAMNMPSVDKFLPRVRPGGLVLVNSSIVTEPIERHDVTIHAIPATQIAIDVGNPKVANMAMLAGFLTHTDFFGLEDVEQVLHQRFGEKYPKLIPLNLEAVKRGM
ncbi:MAG: 2-oxoacid:acceptor oxidoreductase family protein [Oscillospiraceae bacterium]|nr:2-oxoacid:acceptor oxidoreductase family protein [Oscillospiraceae bacterium]